MIRRLSFQPIDDYLLSTHEYSQGREQLGAEEVMERLGPLPGHGRVSVRTIHRWRDDGVDVWLADVIATALAKDPCSLWGPEWGVCADDAAEEWLRRRPRESENAWRRRTGMVDA